MPSKPVVLAVGVVIGVLLAAVGATVVTPAERVSSPAVTVQTATGCVDDPPGDGWIGQFATADAHVVAVNLTLRHDTAGLDVDPDLTEGATGRYTLSLTTTPDTRKAPPPTDCDPRTTVLAAVTLPADYRSLDVTLDGDRITTAARPEGGVPAVRSLDPVTARP